MARLKVVSWNIGLRGLEKLCADDAVGAADVHGISRRMGFGSLGGMLAALDADVVCLQEVKLKQPQFIDNVVLRVKTLHPETVSQFELTAENKKCFCGNYFC